MPNTRDANHLVIISIFFLVLGTLTMIRHVFIVFAAWSLAFGVGLALLLLRGCNSIPNLLMLLQLTKKGGQVLKVKLKPKESGGCTVCLHRSCSRHRAEMLNHSRHLTKNPTIPQSVDAALTEFLEIVLQTHLYSWYWDLSRDQGFVDEMRSMAQHLVSIVLLRLEKTNISEFLLKRCLRKFLIHLDCCYRAKEEAKPGDDIQLTVLEKMKAYKHFTLQNNTAEEEYLRYLTHVLMPYLTPRKLNDACASTHLIEELCTGLILKPLMEKVSEPDVINHLLLRLLEKSTLTEVKKSPPNTVELLGSFSNPRSRHIVSPLEVSLYELMHNAVYLYPMMQFMKQEGALNLLQFCLAVEEFNQRSLAVDVSAKEQVKLIEEAKEIHNTYFAMDAVDKINFPLDVVDDFADAILSTSSSQLKTAAPLFRAFEYASNLLETVFIPRFHRSNEFYALVCGERSPKHKKLAESNLEKRRFMPLAELSKLANKIKAKKQLSREDRSFDYYDGAITPPEEAFEPFCDSDASEDETYDLSFWHVTMPYIDFVLEGNRKCYVFIINVEIVGNKTSVEETNWQVVRKHNEFYVLDSKLRRFHESLNEVELPTKRTIFKKDYDYLNSIRLKLQEYLQRLVRSPVLRSSSLLHSFLTPGSEITGMFEPESVGKEAERKMKSLTSKLVSEKGQNLELFLNSFLATAEPPPKKRIAPRGVPVHMGHRRRDSRMYLPPPLWARDYKHPPFGDPSKPYSPSTVSTYLLYSARNFLKVPSWLHHVIVCLQYLCMNTFNAFVDRYVAYKLSLVTSEQQLVTYIHLIRDIIFFDNDPPRTDSDKLARRDKTLRELLAFCPEQLRVWIGAENHDQALRIAFEMFQYPRLNKQLLYVLLDEAIDELFPEMKKHQTEKT